MTTVDDLADELFELKMTASPLEATMLGVPGRDHLLDDPSLATEEAVAARARDIATRAGALEPAIAEERVTAAVVAQQATALAEMLGTRQAEYTIADIFVSPIAGLLTVLPLIPLPDAERADAYLQRLGRVPDYVDAVAERNRAGVAAGRLPIAHHVRATIAYLDRLLAVDVAADPLCGQEAPLAAAGFDAERERLVAEVVRPALAGYRRVLADEIADHGRSEDQAGICWLPGGEEDYAALVRVHTTTDRDPQELHETGLRIIDELAGDYAELGSRVLGTSDLGEIFAKLREDPAMRWHDADELLGEARTAIERAERVSPSWFGRLPAQRCKVAAVPESEAPGAPAAYYMQPAMDGSRPGTYYANTHGVEQRFRYQSQAMAFHEGVPGHHFQLSLALELEDLPMIRKTAAVNAFIEGWGLYSERLADEMGLYTDDTARLGMLALDSMRACRLVVDTGMHALRWSRQQAIDYMRANAPMAELEIVAEVDRYLSYPGQALSYMVGRLELQRIRAAAEAELGDRFDIKGFHDVVLGGGALPLSVLETVVQGWAKAQP
ncbi:DUF885 domain-containing protein [Labedaea rhizosphaerae]|nr:DUF885 domain-containing protein [Labedaea rhizosphaerae]